MTGMIDTLTAPPPVLPAPAIDPSSPPGTADLRMTQSGIKPAKAASPATDLPTAPSDDAAAKDLEAAINERLARLLGSDVQLSIQLDKDSGHYVYKSINRTTGETDRQYPAENILRMLAFFRELDGLLYDKKA